MLPCAPYVKNMCQNINNHLFIEEEASGDKSPHESPEKKDSIEQINDVKSFEVKLSNPNGETNMLSVVDDSFVNTKPDLYKVIRKIRPDSPDVIRAAKRVEQARLRRPSNSDQILESIKENSSGSRDIDLGAINRING